MSLFTHDPGRRTRWLVYTFLFIELIDEIVDGLTGAAWPLIRTDLDLNYAEIGLALTIPRIVAQLVEPPIGLLGDIWHRFALIALGGLAFATSLLLVAGADGFVALVLAWSLFYPASGTFVGLSQASLVDARPDDEERAMVAWTVAGSLGVAIGPILLAGALAAGAGWRDAFALLAAAALVGTGAAFALRPRGAQVNGDDAPTPTMLEALRTAWTHAKRAATLRWLALLAAVDLLLEVFVGFLALYLVDEAGASPGLAAVGMTIWTIAALAGEAFLLRTLSRGDGVARVRRSAFFVVAGLVAFLVIDDLAVKLALVALLAVSSAGWYSILIARFYRELDGQTGTAMAVASVFGPIQALVPAALGAVAEMWGLKVALWAVLLAPLALIIGLARRA